jgi:hypothetical protein
VPDGSAESNLCQQAQARVGVLARELGKQLVRLASHHRKGGDGGPCGFGLARFRDVAEVGQGERADLGDRTRRA